MKKQTCTVCKKTDTNSIICAREMFLGLKDIFEYFHCKNCGSLLIATPPLNINYYYKNYYSLYNNENYFDTKFRNFLKKTLINSRISGWKYKICSYLLNTQNDLRLKSFSLCNLKKSSAILDVGCGSGEFLKELFFLGYKNLTGIDAFLENDIFISNNIQIYKKTIFEVTGKFNLIMFHHSLEHMDNLNEVLAHVYELLEDDGICLIRIPHVDSFSFRKFQGNWFSIHAPFHFTLPSLNGMELLAKNARLKIQKRLGEQLYYFFLLSNNHKLGITDYEDLGIRKHFESSKVFKGIPPLYTSTEIRYWKKKSKAISETGLEDWIAYFLTKN